MAVKTIQSTPQIVRLVLFIPTIALVVVGFLCGLVASPFASGFNLGYKLSRQYLMLADLEK